MSEDPTTWDLEGAVVTGNEAGLIALVECVRRYGARDLELGYDWPDDAPEPTASDRVYWYAQATFRRRGTRGTEVVRRGAWAEPGQHVRAQIDALAELVRSRGGVVELVAR